METADQFAIPAPILRHFDLTSSPWDAEFSERCIQQRQILPGGKLFFDRLLEFANIDGQALYPPKSPADLRRLLHAIHATELDRLKKDCYYYYLLGDYDSKAPELTAVGHIEGMDVDNEDGAIVKKSEEDDIKTKRRYTFSKQRCMPSLWRTFIDGYWALDNGKWEQAVNSLSDPSITEVNFIPEIITTLSTLVSPPDSACSHVLNFVRFVQPQLSVNSMESDVRVAAIASAASLTEAFKVIRFEFSSEQQERMREIIWCWALGAPRVPCGRGIHLIQPQALKELLHIPLHTEEESHLVNFLCCPPRNIPSESLSKLHDLVTLRLIHRGHYKQALQLDKKLAGNGAGTQDDKQKRRDMVREFVSKLPDVHRKVLLADVEVSLRREEKEMNSYSGQVNTNGQWAHANGTTDGYKASQASISDSTASAPIFTPTSIPSGPMATPMAPTPIRPSGSSSALAHLTRASPRSTTPSQSHSPFNGPPRFATAAAASTSSPRQNQPLVGSPFNISGQASDIRSKRLSPDKPRPKPLINDDDQQEDNTILHGSVKRKGKGLTVGNGSLRKSARQASQGLEPEESVVDENHPIDAIREDGPWSPPTTHTKETRPTRRPKHIQVREKPESSPVIRSNRTRQKVSQGEGSYPQDEPPARRTRASSVQSEAPTPSTRKRMTRSVSRALADSDLSDGDAILPSPKKTVQTNTTRKRRGSVSVSEISETGGNEVQTPRVKRSTRRGAASPTPSVAGSETGTRSRKRKDAIPTSRMSTRSRKV
ncbi:hypothetical protein L204_101615 [Cryptococcus depauperatus]|nr:hypothetical protein L204_04420 [Cryptococcus depauperatus CBS 7855]